MSSRRRFGLKLATGAAAAALGTAFIAGPAAAQPSPPVDDPVGEVPDLQDLLCTVISLDVVLEGLVLTDEAGNEIPLQDLTGAINATPSLGQDLPTDDLPVDVPLGHQVPDLPTGEPVDLDIADIVLGSDPLAGGEAEGAPASAVLSQVEDAANGVPEQAFPSDEISELLSLVVSVPSDVLAQASDATDTGTFEEPTAELVTELKSTEPVGLDVKAFADAAVGSGGAGVLDLGNLLAGLEGLELKDQAGTVYTLTSGAANGGIGDRPE
ncbi:hypothetical protein [Salininema proteolyticum]|uniref:Secreted protein n=1 Tax=Salininema proteolyticum TaxID=1607685 RepID=A0ABV8TYM5_9ACTN